MTSGRALLQARQFFQPTRPRSEDGWNEPSTCSRDWEAANRRRWQRAGVVRPTHDVACTGSCSWRIHVKDGLVTWETRQSDFPWDKVTEGVLLRRHPLPLADRRRRPQLLGRVRRPAGGLGGCFLVAFAAFCAALTFRLVHSRHEVGTP